MAAPAATTQGAELGVNAGRAIVDVLRAEGVTSVFGMPGGHIIGIYDALLATPEIRHVLVRHEQIAAGLAAGHAQLTGEPAVCLVTAGPGVTNLLTGIAEAFVGALPVVIIAGRGSTKTRFRGASQELDTDRVFAPVTKMAVRVDRSDLIVDVLRQAFCVARSGKPGPVLVEIPLDVHLEDVPSKTYIPVGPPSRLAAEPSVIAAAADALMTAERPIIVAGGGTAMSGAFTELRELAEMTATPVLTSLAGRGSIPDDHPLSAGGLGAHRNAASKRLLADADVVLGLGTRFEEMETSWRPGSVPATGACYIQVDVDPAEIGRSVPAQIGIVGDVRTVLEDLLVAIRAKRPEQCDWRSSTRTRELGAAVAELDVEIERLAASATTPIHPLRVIRTARQVFPRETTVAFDVGVLAQHIAGAFPFFRVFEPRSCLVPSSFYGMGFAASALPVARMVHPERPAIGFVGDGSFQMVLSVLPMAAEYELGVTWIVLNDQALGSIRDIQLHAFGGRVIDTEFRLQPDFAGLAAACGCMGVRIDDPADVHEAFVSALRANEDGQPAVLDFAVAPVRLAQTREHYTHYPLED
jgi:acetolactate synthase I/II/III large subunit